MKLFLFINLLLIFSLYGQNSDLDGILKVELEGEEKKIIFNNSEEPTSTEEVNYEVEEVQKKGVIENRVDILPPSSSTPTPTPIPTPTPAPTPTPILKPITQPSTAPQAEEAVNFTRNLIRAENQPLGAVLDYLAALSQIDYLRKPFEKEPNVTFRFYGITPLEALQRLIDSYALTSKIIGSTLVISDKEEEKTEVRNYYFHFVQARWVLQPIANLLGIELSSPSNTSRVYPSTNDSGGVTGVMGSENVGLNVTPRWQSSLPLDDPLYKKDENVWLFLDRQQNSIVLSAFPSQHLVVERFVRSLDRPEPQIILQARIVELTTTDDKLYGTDMQRMLGEGVNVRGSGSWNIDPVSVLIGAGGKPNLTLELKNAEVTLRALQSIGQVKVMSLPITVTRSGVPVSIYSNVVESASSFTAATQSQQLLQSGYNTFTTGVTLEVLPILLPTGNVDINVKIGVSGKIGEKEDAGKQKIPILSNRGITASGIVASDSTLLIGGLVELRSENKNVGIPILQKIPILGGTVLGSTDSQATRRIMLLLLTPQVIYPTDRIANFVDKDTAKLLRNIKSKEPLQIKKAEPIPTPTPIHKKIKQN